METIIKLNNLTKKYTKHKVALDNVSLDIKKGGIVGLLGPNGSGKTTLIKVLCGLLKDYEGDVLIDGRTVGPYTKSIISYLPDEPYFAKWMKVKDVLKLFVDMYIDFDLERCLTMLKRFDLEESMSIKAMSKGMKEKFQLALVMSRRAAIVILDELIGGVDPAAREVILDTILTNYDDTQTIIIATHLIADIEKIFDTVLFIKNGSIVLNKEVEDVRNETGKSIDELFRDEFRY